MISIMISGLKYLLALTSYYQKRSFLQQFKKRERVFTIMNTNEISGKRQLEFLADFDYIREAGTARRRKSSRKDSENSGQFWRGESSGRIFF